MRTMHINLDGTSLVGVTIGAAVGMFKSVFALIGALTWPFIWESAAVTAISALVGFVVVEVLKLLKKKIFKEKK